MIYLHYCNNIHLQCTQTEHIYQARPDCLNNQPQISWKEREILVNWLIIIQVEFSLLPETLFITVNIIDRYLSRKRIPLDQL